MLRYVRTSRDPTWMRNNNSYYVCRDRIVVSRLRCVRNNPGSNPGLGKYYILYSVLHPYKPDNDSGSKETLYCFLRFAFWSPEDFTLSQVRTSH